MRLPRIQSIDLAQRVKTAGPIKDLLFGLGHEAIPEAERILHPSGVINSEAPAFKALVGEGFGNKAKHILQTLTIGEHPGKVLGQRYTQGGLFGHGGLIRSPYALSPHTLETIKDPKYLLKHPMDAAGGLLTDAASHAFLTALPAYSLYKGVQRGDQGAIGETVGETLGNIAGWPLGGVGGIVLPTIGRQLGGAVAGGHELRPPPMEAYTSSPYPQMQEKMSGLNGAMSTGATAPKLSPAQPVQAADLANKPAATPMPVQMPGLSPPKIPGMPSKPTV